jgi:CRISPR/Cas system CMR-associated protein Cmr1 (group 7 of RAMP superfamily)
MDKNNSKIRKEILLKNSDKPYFVENTIYSITNDHNVFPYPRWYIGKAGDSSVHIAEREAGWCPKNVTLTKKKVESQIKNSTMCFQTACSVIYPCYLQDSGNYLMSNKECMFG